MSKPPTINRKVPVPFRLPPETIEHIKAVSIRLEISKAETVQLAVNSIDENALGLRSEVIKAARECLTEADEKLEMLERGHV